MTRSSPQAVSLPLRAWRDGDKSALDRLMPLVYNELRRLAHRYMIREKAGHTLQTTTLVNEAYLRLVDLKWIEWQDRTPTLVWDKVYSDEKVKKAICTKFHCIWYRSA